MKIGIDIGGSHIATGIILDKGNLIGKETRDIDVADIKEENGIKKYILKDTEIKMNFIIDKHDKINIGDKFLCVSEGFAFKYDNSKQ